MPAGKDLDFSVHLHTINNLIDKLRSLERVCGASMIHDTRLHLSILVNWSRNLEFYSKSDATFEMWDHTKDTTGFMEMFEPDQDYVDSYFNDICRKAEAWLIRCSKVLSTNKDN